MFIERGFDLIVEYGYNAMVTMEAWMFLSSYERLRNKLLKSATINSMVHMPYLGKGGTSMGISFGTAATVFQYKLNPHIQGQFCCVRYYETDDNGVPFEFPVRNERLSSTYSTDFLKITGSPIAYWVSEGFINAFTHGKKISDIATTRQGMSTDDNDKFVRCWYEVGINFIGFNLSRESLRTSSKKWYPYLNGGPTRKWYGNLDDVVNWQNNGEQLQTELDPTGKRVRAHNFNLDFIFNEGLSWTSITSGSFSIRYFPKGFLFSSASNALFSENYMNSCMGLLNSKIYSFLGSAINPTLNANPGDIGKIPLPSSRIVGEEKVTLMISLSKSDWDSYETSWDFTTLPLLQKENECQIYLKHWMDSSRDSKIFEGYTKEMLAENGQDLEKSLQAELDKRDIQTYLEAEAVDTFDKVLILNILKSLSSSVDSTEEDFKNYLAWIDTRRTKHWFSEYDNIYNALEYAVKLFRFAREYYDNPKAVDVLENTRSLYELFKAYAETYYQIDYLYRKFYYYYDKEQEKDILKKSLRPEVEKLYTKNLLEKLLLKWSSLIDFELRNG